MAVDWMALERAAEQTISAAAAALLWAGEDSQGILAHVAAADPCLMAGTRLVYDRLAVGRSMRDVVLNLREEYHSTTTLFEVAALPSLVAPGWTARVLAALKRPARDYVSAQEAAAQDYALYICSLWGREHLDVDKITDWANSVSSSTARCWRLANRRGHAA